MTVPVVIYVPADAPAEDVDQLLDDVRAIGLDPTLKAVPTRRGVSVLFWLVLLAVPVKPFFEELSRKFADDAYARLKSLVGKALSRQRTPHDDSRVLVLQDTATGLTIALESDLPLTAYQQLFGMDHPTTLPPGTLRYDQNSQEWRAKG